MELGVDISALNAVLPAQRAADARQLRAAQRPRRPQRPGGARRSPTARRRARTTSTSSATRRRWCTARCARRCSISPTAISSTATCQAVWLACTEAAARSRRSPSSWCSPEPERPLKTEVRRPMAQPRVAERGDRAHRARARPARGRPHAGARPLVPGARRVRRRGRRRRRSRASTQAFDRWRDLFTAAEQQRDAARRTMDDYAAPQQEKRAAKSRHAQAIDQLNLLQQGTSTPVERLLHLPLPRDRGLPAGLQLPAPAAHGLRPGDQRRPRRQTYLQRPRFLALSEFGPRSLVYHEGRAYRVVRALLVARPPGTAARADAHLPTQVGPHLHALRRRPLRRPGVACATPAASSLGDAEIVNHVYRIENVATQPAERITANDEERQRQGFELQTTFEWAVRDQRARRAARRGGRRRDGEIARLAYGPGATITRLNKGLRRRANRTQLGFRIDPVSGYWAEERGRGRRTVRPDRVAAPVDRAERAGPQERAAAPAGRSADSQQARSPRCSTRCCAASRRCSSSRRARSSPSRCRPATPATGFLLYEATEGGAGVLTRLVARAGAARRGRAQGARDHALRRRGRGGLPAEAEALADAPDTACVAACYRCLMSYYNQPDHELLDRRDLQARDVPAPARPRDHAPASTRRRRAARCSRRGRPARATTRLAPLWLALARARELPPPDAEPLVLLAPLVTASLGFRSSGAPTTWRRSWTASTARHSSSLADLRLRASSLLRPLPRPPPWAEPFSRLAACPRTERVTTPCSYEPGALQPGKPGPRPRPRVDRAHRQRRRNAARAPGLRLRGGPARSSTSRSRPSRSRDGALPAARRDARRAGHDAALLLRDALLLSLRRGAGPFRSFGQIAVEPRAYQLVPLLMALKLDPVRLLIADDVGIGKTIEAALIARELLDRGEIERIAVLCPPHLVDQWVGELETRFHLRAGRRDRGEREPPRARPAAVARASSRRTRTRSSASTTSRATGAAPTSCAPAPSS